MNTDYAAIVITILFTVATSTLLGGYMYRVFTGGHTWLDPILEPIERLVLRLTGVDPTEQQDWKSYSISLLISNVFMWLATWTIVTLQQYLPLNPDGIGNMAPTLAFNTISSFVTNTNLQHYSGETGLSYFSQMFTITFLQFVTAATGVAAGVATIRGLAGNRLTYLGNFYVDMTRATIRLFLPLGGICRRAGDVAGHAADVRRSRDCDHSRRRGTENRARRHGWRRVDQAARHQRRGLLRAELDPPVREPDAALELHRDVVDHHHPDVDGGDAGLHGGPT
jgi:Potassium-transporting ATPase A subunit